MTNEIEKPEAEQELGGRVDSVVMRRCRMDFENWLMSEGVSIERYERFPQSYVVTDVGTKWVAWQAAHRQYA